MQEREARTAEPQAPRAPSTATAQAAPPSPTVQRVLTLQRSAGNAAVSQMLQRQEADGRGLKWDPSLLPKESLKWPPDPIRFVFILGAKDDDALKKAASYYEFNKDIITRVLKPGDFEPTLAGVFAYLSQIKYPIAEITMVVHGTGSGTLSVPLNDKDTDQYSSTDEVEQAVREGGFAPLTDGQITPTTRIRLQACFVGNSTRMINLLDRAFGDGAGTVIAPKVEVGFNKSIITDEGLTGWWVVFEGDEPTAEEIGAALKAKYAKALGKLDLATFDSGDRVGQTMTEDEMWLEMARRAEHQPGVVTGGKTRHIYIANAWTQRIKPGYEDQAELYSKSVYYSPTEI